MPCVKHCFFQVCQYRLGGFNAQISLDQQRFQVIPGFSVDLSGAQKRGNTPEGGFAGAFETFFPF